MAAIVKVKWEISDGYVGGSRPQIARIDPSSFVGLTREDAAKEFNDIMEEEFRERVGWECDDEAALDEIMAAAAKLELSDG